MTAKHTPGPWESIPPKTKGKHWKVGARGRLGGKGSTAGASVLWDLASIANGAPGDTLATEEANADLIAAAPEMFAAMQAVAKYAGLLNLPLDVSNAFHHALAKAEGRAP